MPKAAQPPDAEFEQFNTRYPAALLTRVRDAARAEDLNVGQWIRRACTESLDRHQAVAPAEPEGT